MAVVALFLFEIKCFKGKEKKNNIRIFESFPFTPNKLQVAREVLWLLKISWIFWKDFSAEGKINPLTLKSTVLDSVEYLNWVLNYNIISSLAHNNESSDQLVCMFMFLFVCVCVCAIPILWSYTLFSCVLFYLYIKYNCMYKWILGGKEGQDLVWC